MEMIIAYFIGILLAIAVGAMVYWFMRQQCTQIRQQLVTAEQTLSEEQQKLQETKLLLSQKELELRYEKEKNETARKQADEKLTEQIKFLKITIINYIYFAHHTKVFNR